jgi:photosystem II stability/assembly factor-like uncharacterized protein
MNRREFLKVSLMSAVSYVALGPMGNFLSTDVEAVVAGKTYRGTQDGKIMISGNGGRSWQLHTKFGPGYSILNIFTAKDNHLYVSISHKHANFYLVLAKNGKAWLSQPFKTKPQPR